MKRALIQSVGMLVMAWGLTSCLTLEQTMSINPDNTGKSEFVSSVDLSGLEALGGEGGGGQAQDINAVGMEMLAQFVKGTKGVETWGDLKYEAGKKGELKISGTAYFADINKFSMGAGEGTGTTDIKSSLKDGVWTIETVEVKPAAGDGDKAPEPSEAKIAENIKNMQKDWGQMKGVMEVILGTLNMTINVKLGGTITKTVNFKKVDANSASMSLEGKKLVSALDKMIMDPKLSRKMARGGFSSFAANPQMPETPEFYGLLLGESAYPKIVAKPGKPLFNYKEEVAKAKANPTKAMKQLLRD